MTTSCNRKLSRPRATATVLWLDGTWTSTGLWPRARIWRVTVVAGTLIVNLPSTRTRAPIVVQTTQTDFDDNDAGLSYFANGTELDAAYAYVSDGALHLFFTGSMFGWVLDNACGPVKYRSASEIARVSDSTLREMEWLPVVRGGGAAFGEEIDGVAVDD